MYLYEGFNAHQKERKKAKRGKKRISTILILFFLFYPLLISEHDSYSLSSPQPPFFKEQPFLPPDLLPSPPLPITKETSTDTGFKAISGCVCSGNSLYSILSAHGFSPTVISECLSALKPIFNCRKVAPGNEYTIVTDTGGGVLSLTIKVSPADIYHLTKKGRKLVASKEEVVVEKKITKISGEVDQSLFNAIAATEEKEELALAFSDVFAWDIDFRHALQKGDRFKVIFEKYFARGVFIRYGKILAAEYVNQDKVHRAIYFKGSKGFEGYYSPGGNSLRKSFLRSPLRFTHISSAYSVRRFHPVLREFRPHLGVDFSAPTGTSVWAVGDGVVTWKGWKLGNGNTVTIRHPLGYETMYNHLSRYGKGIALGKRVVQKDIIGYVGTTGLSTGPHLDYRMSKNGRSINPLKGNFPPGFPLDPSCRTAFATVSQQMLASLDKDFNSSPKTIARLRLMQ